MNASGDRVNDNPYKSPQCVEAPQRKRFVDRIAEQVKAPLTPLRTAIVCLPFSATGVFIFRILRTPREHLTAVDAGWVFTALAFALGAAFMASIAQLFCEPEAKKGGLAQAPQGAKVHSQGR
jgi:TRAP-type C4-dicarboxylate transport system permease small subunit